MFDIPWNYVVFVLNGRRDLSFVSQRKVKWVDMDGALTSKSSLAIAIHKFSGP
jgi:hypothetical protein